MYYIDVAFRLSLTPRRYPGTQSGLAFPLILVALPKQTFSIMEDVK